MIRWGAGVVPDGAEVRLTSKERESPVENLSKEQWVDVVTVMVKAQTVDRDELDPMEYIVDILNILDVDEDLIALMEELAALKIAATAA